MCFSTSEKLKAKIDNYLEKEENLFSRSEVINKAILNFLEKQK